jgi:hypothetical protein
MALSPLRPGHRLQAMAAPPTGHPKPRDSEYASLKERQREARVELLEHLLEGQRPITEDEIEAVSQEMNGGHAPAMLPRVAQPIPLADAIKALKRDPAHPVLVKVDEELTVEVRAVAPGPALKRSAADVFREVGRWEGETGEELDALFADVRQCSNRPVPGLP